MKRLILALLLIAAIWFVGYVSGMYVSRMYKDYEKQKKAEAKGVFLPALKPGELEGPVFHIDTAVFPWYKPRKDTMPPSGIILLPGQSITFGMTIVRGDHGTLFGGDAGGVEEMDLGNIFSKPGFEDVPIDSSHLWIHIPGSSELVYQGDTAGKPVWAKPGTGIVSPGLTMRLNSNLINSSQVIEWNDSSGTHITRAKDTVKVLMLLSDSSADHTEIHYVDSITKEVIFIDSSMDKPVTYRNGYSVREAHNTCEGVGVIDQTFDMKGCKTYWVHAFYLDADKKPLSKSIIVWQSTETKKP